MRGDFITSFDFSGHPFETQTLVAEIEHKNLDIDSLIFEQNPASDIDPGANVPGWNMGAFETSTQEHSYGAETFRVLSSA